MRRLGWSDRIALVALVAMAAFSLVVLVSPALIVFAISFDTREYVSFPPQGFTLRWYAMILDKRQILSAFLVSFKVAALTTMLCLLLGLPAAIAAVRGRFPGRAFVGVFVLAPHTIPGIVLGVAILIAGATAGLPASTPMLIAGLACFYLALATRLVMAQLAGLDPALEQASLNLGASRFQTFIRVTLPQLMPAVFAGAAFTFIESFDNVSVAMFTHDYRARPLPVELLGLVETDNTPLVAAISGVEILLACLILVSGAAALGLERFSGSSR